MTWRWRWRGCEGGAGARSSCLLALPFALLAPLGRAAAPAAQALELLLQPRAQLAHARRLARLEARRRGRDAAQPAAVVIVIVVVVVTLRPPPLLPALALALLLLLLRGPPLLLRHRQLTVRVQLRGAGDTS